VVVSPVRGKLGAAIIELSAGASVIELRLHQAAKVHELNLKCDLKPIKLAKVEVSVFHPDRSNDVLHKFKEVTVGPNGHPISLNGAVTAIVRIKLNALRAFKLHLTVAADVNYLDSLARKTRVSRHVSALSQSNSERRDNRFDSKYIKNGQLLEALAKEPALPFSWREQALFPFVPQRNKNILGEPIANGSTILVPLMNRNANVEKNLACWLKAGFDEVVLMDWASEVPVASLPIVQQSESVRVIRVDGPTRYIRTWAMNLANRCIRRQKVLKCDSDVEVSSNFLKVHELRPGRFIVGDWQHARDLNERHLHGDVYYNLYDFDRVNGFDERIINYGQEDTNLTDRMLLAGLEKQVLSYDTLRHQEHTNSQRGSNQNVVHPMVNTFYYRSLCNFRSLWSRHEASLFTATLEHVTPREVKFHVEDKHVEQDDPEALNAAIDMVASWYLTADDSANLSREDKLALIWDRSKE